MFWSPAYAQEGGGLPNNSKTATLSVYTSLNQHFDGSPVTQPYFRKKYGALASAGLGGEYSRTTAKGRQYNIGLHYYQARYFYDTPFFFELGDVRHRYYYLLSFSKMTSLSKSYAKFQITLKYGLTYRFGEETYVSGNNVFGDPHFLKGALMTDLGINTGLRLIYPIFGKLLICTEANYTFFLLRYDRGKNSPYSWFKGSSKHLAIGKLGLAYLF